MRSRIHHRASAERGGIIVEAALGMLFLMAVVMGVMEYGRAFYFQQVLTNAALESSKASASGFEAYTTAAYRVLSPAGIPSPAPACGGSPSEGQATICQTVETVWTGGSSTEAHQVSIVYNVPFMTPLGPVLNFFVGDSGWGSGVTLASTAVTPSSPN